MPIGDVEKCVSLLNERLRGTAISHLVEKMEALKPIISDYVIEHDALYQAFAQAFIRFASDRLSLYGKDELFGQPEYAHDAEKLKKMLELLDSPSLFRQVSSKSSGGVSIDIDGFGHEFGDVSIVTGKIKIPGNADGTIALVGPTRMDYEKVVNALEYVTKELDEYFKKSTGSKPKTKAIKAIAKKEGGK